MGNLASISFLPRVDPLDTSIVGQCGGINSRFLEENGPVPAIIFPSGQPMTNQQGQNADNQPMANMCGQNMDPQAGTFHNQYDCPLHPFGYTANGWNDWLVTRQQQLRDPANAQNLYMQKSQASIKSELERATAGGRRNKENVKKKSAKESCRGSDDKDSIRGSESRCKKKRQENCCHNFQLKMIKELHDTITKKKLEDEELEKVAMELLEAALKPKNPIKAKFMKTDEVEPILIQSRAEPRASSAPQPCVDFTCNNALLELEKKNLFLSLENRILYDMVVKAKASTLRQSEVSTEKTNLCPSCCCSPSQPCHQPQLCIQPCPQPVIPQTSRRPCHRKHPKHVAEPLLESLQSSTRKKGIPKSQSRAASPSIDSNHPCRPISAPVQPLFATHLEARESQIDGDHDDTKNEENYPSTQDIPPCIELRAENHPHMLKNKQTNLEFEPTKLVRIREPPSYRSMVPPNSIFYQYDPSCGTLINTVPPPFGFGGCIPFPQDGKPVKIRAGNRIALLENKKQLNYIASGNPFFIRNEAACRSPSCSSLKADMSYLSKALKNRVACEDEELEIKSPENKISPKPSQDEKEPKQEPVQKPVKKPVKESIQQRSVQTNTSVSMVGKKKKWRPFKRKRESAQPPSEDPRRFSKNTVMNEDNEPIVKK